MKKPVVVLIVACLAVLSAGPFIVNSSADNDPGMGLMLRTTPVSNYHWTTSTTVGPGTAASTGSVEYAGGPRVPNSQGDGDISPHGGGSLRFEVGTEANSLAQARNPYLDGALVGGVDVEYSWITTAPAASGNATQASTSSAPTLQLVVTSSNAGRETLTYEPSFNQSQVATPFATWERDDAGAPRNTCAEFRPAEPNDDGCWWGSRTGTGVRFSLARYAQDHPGARVVTDQAGGGFAVVAGCFAPQPSPSGPVCNAEWANFEGAVDDVTLQRASVDPKTTFDFEPTIITVWPGVPQGWTFAETPTSDSVTRPTVSFVGGPGNPIFGTGSMRLAVGDKGDNLAEARTSDFNGRTVAGIDALAYDTYVTSRAATTATATCAEAPYLRLETARVATDGAPVTGQTLIFHPCDQRNGSANPGVPANTWQRWDAARGVWRWEEPLLPARAQAPTVCDQAPDGTSCRGTLANYSTMYPGDETAGTLAIGAGGGASTNPNGDAARWVNFVGHADFLTRDHSAFTGRTYDFEAQAPAPPATTTTTNPNATTTTVAGGGGAPTSTTTPRRTTTTTRGSGTTTTEPSNTTTTRDPDDPPAQVSRLQGADRLATAIDISQSDFGDDEAGAVVLARAENYPDALAATPLAGDRRGPLLLTFPDSLDNRVEDEIRRVLPAGGTVHLAGGSSAISPAVENRLREGGFNVLRHGGRNRFETATLLAEQISAPAIAFLATGLNFPDALPAGAAAIAERGVVLLTADSQMPAETTAYLNARPGLRRFAVGGQAAAADPGSERAVGDNRFETAVAVARRFFPGATTAGVASGTNFPDALAGGAHIGSRDGPLLLTPHEPLPDTVRQWLADHSNTLRNVFIYGGPAAITTNTENEIRAAVS